ncbi:MAG: zinc-ribbon domain-containing protein [Collinsella sp.]
MLRNKGCIFGFTFMVERMHRKEPAMFCRSCGTPLVDDALFCPVCGAPVAPDQVAATQQPQPAAPAPQQYVPAQQPARRKRSRSLSSPLPRCLPWRRVSAGSAVLLHPDCDHSN